MNNSLQNKITRAVKCGVTLGFDLCDIDLNVDNTLEKDLQDYKKEFNALDLHEQIKDIIENQYLPNYPGCPHKQETFVMQFLETLCCKYTNKFYACYKVDNPYNLRILILRLAYDFGDTINLNWIDVSEIDKMCFICPGRGDLQGLFQNVIFKGDISQWDVSNCIDMTRMFKSSIFNGDISRWDVSNVKNMSEMFRESAFNGDISKWDVHTVTNMNHMFSYSQFNNDLTHWNLKNLKTSENMFERSYISEKNLPRII